MPTTNNKPLSAEDVAPTCPVWSGSEKAVHWWDMKITWQHCWGPCNERRKTKNTAGTGDALPMLFPWNTFFEKSHLLLPSFGPSIILHYSLHSTSPCSSLYLSHFWALIIPSARGYDSSNIWISYFAASLVLSPVESFYGTPEKRQQKSKDIQAIHNSLAETAAQHSWTPSAQECFCPVQGVPCSFYPTCSWCPCTSLLGLGSLWRLESKYAGRAKGSFGAHATYLGVKDTKKNRDWSAIGTSVVVLKSAWKNWWRDIKLVSLLKVVDLVVPFGIFGVCSPA